MVASGGNSSNFSTVGKYGGLVGVGVIRSVQYHKFIRAVQACLR